MEPQLAEQFGSAIGTRTSAVDNKTTEYYDKSTNQGFQNPTALFDFASKLGFGAISSFDQLKTGTSTSTLNTPGLSYPTGTPGKNPADSVAGITPADQAALNEYAGLSSATRTPEQIAAEKKQEELLNTYETEAKRLEGKSDAYLAKEREFGVDENFKRLQDENLKLTSLKNQFDSAENKSYNRLTTMGDILGEVGEVRRQRAVEVNAQASLVAALQGNYETARTRAKEAVDLQFAPIEQRLTNTYNFLQLNEGKLNREEKKQAEKLKAITDARASQLAAQKEARQFAIENGIKSPFYNYGGTVYRTSDGKAYSKPEEAFKDGVKQDFSNAPEFNVTLKEERALVADMAAKYVDAGIAINDSLAVAQSKLSRSRIYREQVRGPVGDGGSGLGIDPVTGKQVLKFTNDEFNNALVASGLTKEEFKKLDPYIQNEFINGTKSAYVKGRLSTDAITKYSKAIAESITNGEGLGELRSTIDSADIPQADKEELKQVAEDEYRKQMSFGRKILNWINK